VLPLGALYTPLRSIAELPAVPYEPVRCKGCVSVLNPYARVDFVGKARAAAAALVRALSVARADLDLPVLSHAQPLPSALRGHQRAATASGAVSGVYDPGVRTVEAACGSAGVFVRARHGSG